MTDHVLNYTYLDEILTVMHGEGESHHGRSNLRCARPGLHDGFIARAKLAHLLEKMISDERALFETSCHKMI